MWRVSLCGELLVDFDIGDDFDVVWTRSLKGVDVPSRRIVTGFQDVLVGPNSHAIEPINIWNRVGLQKIGD
jgi:hypothetical protein